MKMHEFILLLGVLAVAVLAGNDAVLASANQPPELDQVPQLIQQIDGCKIYRFSDLGQWHYFTNCPAHVETESRRPGWSQDQGAPSHADRWEHVQTFVAQ